MTKGRGEGAPVSGVARAFRITRWCVIAAGVVAAVVLLGINIAFRIPAVEERLRGFASAAARTPVDFDGVSYSPWSGITFHDVTVGPGRDRAPLQLEKLQLEVAPFSVFTDRIQVDRVLVVRPRVKITWQPPVPAAVPGLVKLSPPPPTPLPAVLEPARLAGSPAAGLTVDPAPGEPGEPPPAAELARPPELPKRRGYQLLVGRVVVRGGRLEVRLPGSAVPLVSAEGYGFDASFEKEHPGSVQLQGASVAGMLHLDMLSGTVKWTGEAWEITGITARCGGGQLAGKVVFDPRRHGMPFAAELNLTDASTQALLADTGVPLDGVSGKIRAGLQLQGLALAPVTWQGRARVLSPQISASAPGLAEPVAFQPARASFNLRAGHLLLTDFYAHSDRLTLRALGGITMGGDVSINARVYLDRPVAARVSVSFQGVQEGLDFTFQELPGTHFAFRDIGLRGSVKTPGVILWPEVRAVSLSEVFQILTNLQKNGTPAASSFGAHAPTPDL